VAKGWREYLPNTFGEINWIDPMVRDYRGMEGDFDKEIVVLDKLDIDHSDVVLVYYEQPSIGTSMEIMYAWMTSKPIVIVTKEQKVSPWLTYHATLIVGSFKEAVDFIRRVPVKE
jgi:hypothetical protein